MIRRFSILSAFMFSAFLAPTFSQTTMATLGGTITDATGVSLAGVSVEARNNQTGIVRIVVSNHSGVYQFVALQTGIYRMTAALPGFKTLTYGAVVLGLGQQARLNFTLQLGSSSEVVEIISPAETVLNRCGPPRAGD